jgi:hypothetical protein
MVLTLAFQWQAIETCRLQRQLLLVSVRHILVDPADAEARPGLHVVVFAPIEEFQSREHMCLARMSPESRLDGQGRIVQTKVRVWRAVESVMIFSIWMQTILISRNMYR